MKVEFYKHSLGDAEKVRLMKCLDGIFLTTGSYVREFEEKFAEYFKASECVGVTSCTAALHLSLLACGVGPGDEVITTPLTFIATANAVHYTGARPVFVDVEAETGLMDPARVEAAITEKTRAIIPVHLYGQMCDMRALRNLADQHSLSLIEDAAHCVEGHRDGIRPSELSDAACFSFYATKNITSGEGGAVVTNDAKLADRLRALRSHGMTKEAAERYAGTYQHWDMSLLGYKYNMFNIQAALLIDQLGGMEDRLQRRENICREYEEAFSNNPNIDLLAILSDSRSARHLLTILVDPARRDEILTRLSEAGIGVAVNYRAIHLLSYFREVLGHKEGDFPNAEMIGSRTISLPLYPLLKKKEIRYVIECVNAATQLTKKKAAV